MKRRIFGLILLCMMLGGAMTTAYAADAEAYNAADVLYDLGLFSGTGTKADGSPNFDLDRAPTRNEAVTMLVRLLGKEAEAKNGTWTIPFTDVDEWAKPYVGYAYANGLTSGTSATTFGGNSTISASQYLTFVLRALGYDSMVDFQWDKAWELSDRIGLTDGRYENAKDFLRGDVTIISRNAMDVKQKGSDQTLAEKLVAENVFSAEIYKKAVEVPAVVKEPDYAGVSDYYHINGERVSGINFINLTVGEQYTVGVEKKGVVYTSLTNVKSDDQNGLSVKNNGDGTFTVTPKKNGTYNISYDFVEIDPEGRHSGFHKHSGVSFRVGPPEKVPGITLLRRGHILRPEQNTGVQNIDHSIFVFEVLFNGEPISDYSVSCNDPNCKITIQADGSLLFLKEHLGLTKFTITCRGKTANFGLSRS